MMAEEAAEAAPVASQQQSARQRRTWRALGHARQHLQRSALKLAGYLVVAYLVLKLIPSLEQALSSLEHAGWELVLVAVVLETFSEMGFVVSWRAIVDPENLLSRDGRGQRMDARVAWAQLGGGTLVPGGSWGGLGVGAWILHHFGMPIKVVAEREFNLSFLNTAIDALTLVFFGLALASGILSGSRNLWLTLLPAAVAAIALTATVLVAHRAVTRAERKQITHVKIAAVIATLSEAVENTERLLRHGRNYKAVFGAVAYLGLDVLVLWVAFLAVHAHPVPTFGVIVMAYIVGALGGSLPLPAGVGTIGGIAGVYQAIALLVPLAGGGIAYIVIRRRLEPIRAGVEVSSG
jgi:Lysylphosphatidylglycerol synthase TM region